MLQAIQLKRIFAAGRKAMRWWRCILPALAVTSFATAHVAHGQEETIEGIPKVQSAALDGTFYTSYNFSADKTFVSWSVAGHTKTTFGGYGSGRLGPFEKVGALLEGKPSTDLSKRTVTRAIYVLDIATGTSQNGVVLYVYKKIDRISATGDKPTVRLDNTISLPLAGGASASTSMAANNSYLYIGTNQTSQAVRVTKNNLQISMIGIVEPSVNVSSITADPYGYVTVTFGAFDSAQSNFLLYGPDGSEQGFGGGTPFTLSTIQAILPVTLP